eukprot:EG_transcript_13785
MSPLNASEASLAQPFMHPANPSTGASLDSADLRARLQELKSPQLRLTGNSAVRAALSILRTHGVPHLPPRPAGPLRRPSPPSLRVGRPDTPEPVPAQGLPLPFAPGRLQQPFPLVITVVPGRQTPPLSPAPPARGPQPSEPASLTAEKGSACPKQRRRPSNMKEILAALQAAQPTSAVVPQQRYVHDPYSFTGPRLV